MIHSYDNDKLRQGYYSYVGTVLLRKDSTATGQSVLLFLRDLGPKWVSAPGARGKKARFGGATEPMVWGEFTLYQSPKWLYLQGGEIKEDFIGIRCEPKKLIAAMRMYKRVAKTLMEGAESNKILNALWSAMVLLDGDCPVRAVEFRFTWKLLKRCGFAPSLTECSECCTRLDGDYRWGENGLLCANCTSGELESCEKLVLMQRAALLSHKRFAEWSKLETENEKFFAGQIDKLVTFFSDFN